jgi:predicted oxidoreductase
MIVPALSVQQVVLIQADLENPYKISKMQHDNNNITDFILTVVFWLYTLPGFSCTVRGSSELFQLKSVLLVLTVTIYTSQFFKIIIKLQENCYRSN